MQSCLGSRILQSARQVKQHHAARAGTPVTDPMDTSKGRRSPHSPCHSKQANSQSCSLKGKATVISHGDIPLRK